MRTPSRRPNKTSRTPAKRTPTGQPQGVASSSGSHSSRDTSRPRRERPAATDAPRTTPHLTKAARAKGPVYIGHVVPGLERLAARELSDTLDDVAVIETLKQFDDRTSLLLFGYSGDASDLLDLTLFEDVFALVVDRAGIGGERAALKVIASLVAGPALDEAFRIANPIRPGNRRKPTYRAIARKAGEHAYRRTDLRSTAEKAIAGRHPDWVLADPARIEVWTQLVGDRLVAGIRLSDETMRQRAYKLANLPASLKPTVARAMALLTKPGDDDVFLDPMCGAGTILIERAHAGRYARLEGGDVEHAAVQAALENIGTRYKPIEIREWDARSLPFADGEIGAIACNLPFGKQIGTRQGNQTLYPVLLDEWIRVLKPGGRMVLLTSEARLLRATARDRPGLVWEQTLHVVVRGLPAEIFVFLRVPDTAG
ncbi:MAG: methyltransferase domain-containing protein [Thermomicrobiales bacterium]